MANLFPYVEKKCMYELDEIRMVIAGSTIGIHECAKANYRIKAEDQRIEKA